jgi:hypothetical protein
MLEAERFPAESTPVESNSGHSLHHSVNVTGLKSNSQYAYRVGSGEIWSEWFHFRTASSEPDPFSFIYLGDAQNNILALWSRAIRSAYSDAPKAAFLLHAGDLVNRADDDSEWNEWFEAGDWIFATIPSIATPGNHEYPRNDRDIRELSRFWRPHFGLPDGAIRDLEETVYFLDYQGVRVISLNSNERLEEQAIWLEEVLSENPNRWTLITFHHPVFSSARGRDNEQLRALWKPLFDQHRVDLVLQGHDHSYARGRNLPGGVGGVDPLSGTVYVVSVSGPKMYRLAEEHWWDRAAENTQLYQIISIDGEVLHYQSLTATGELYDAFDLHKQPAGPNRLVEVLPEETPERLHSNTIGGRPPEE